MAPTTNRKPAAAEPGGLPGSDLLAGGIGPEITSSDGGAQGNIGRRDG